MGHQNRCSPRSIYFIEFRGTICTILLRDIFEDTYLNDLKRSIFNLYMQHSDWLPAVFEICFRT